MNSYNNTETARSSSNVSDYGVQNQIELLRPVSDDDLYKWKAIIIGLKGTPYEGTFHIYFNLDLTI